jgi:hypothetical protein
MKDACMLVFCAALLASLTPSAAAASVERFAVIIGNNHGLPSDESLHYAESDATRVFEVLRDLGGFQPVNMVLLRDENADTVQRTLIAVNDRIRAAVSLPNAQAMLFVYYSGHADADDLHLGTTRLPVTQLAQLARGSSANFRLIVLDACRSGALTRLKGGRILAPFDLPSERMPEDGFAFLTASAANEDAQESDELRASFFTHARTRSCPACSAPRIATRTVRSRSTRRTGTRTTPRFARRVARSAARSIQRFATTFAVRVRSC